MRSYLLVMLVAGEVLAQGRPEVPAHIRNQSVRTKTLTVTGTARFNTYTTASIDAGVVQADDVVVRGSLAVAGDAGVTGEIAAGGTVRSAIQLRAPTVVGTEAVISNGTLSAVGAITGENGLAISGASTFNGASFFDGGVSASSLHAVLVDAGTVLATSANIGTLDAGQAWVGSIGNPDAGALAITTAGIRLPNSTFEPCNPPVNANVLRRMNNTLYECNPYTGRWEFPGPPLSFNCIGFDFTGGNQGLAANQHFCSTYAGGHTFLVAEMHTSIAAPGTCSGACVTAGGVGTISLTQHLVDAGYQTIASLPVACTLPAGQCISTVPTNDPDCSVDGGVLNFGLPDFPFGPGGHYTMVMDGVCTKNPVLNLGVTGFIGVNNADAGGL